MIVIIPRGGIAPAGAVDSKALSKTAASVRGRDPLDGEAPPPLPSESPANPLVVAALLAGRPVVSAEQMAQALGAPLAELLRNKASVLYAHRSEKVRSAGEVALGKDGAKGVARLPRGTDLLADPGAEAPLQAPPVGPPLSVVGWVQDALMRQGIDCTTWRSMSELARLNAALPFYFGTRHPGLPSGPLALVALLDASCGLARVATLQAPTPSPAAQAAQDAVWWAQLRAVGVTCDQWIATKDTGRIDMIRSLEAQGRFDRRGVDVWAIVEAVSRECTRSVTPAAPSPAASILARLRAVLDCARLDAQDKLEQVQVIQRAFPELIRDPRALYRLALARYDLCHPASEGGWTGVGWRWIADPVRNLRLFLDVGWTDILDGDTRGMSPAQWVRQGPYMPSTGPDLFDPVQGTTGDCYFVAAMASVAWTRPEALQRMGQLVGPDRRRFFFGGVATDVSERTPCVILQEYRPLFAHGSRLDAQWPGVVEKAYAAWRTGDSSDRPDMTAIDNMPDTRSVDGLVTGITRALAVSLRALPELAGGSVFWHLTLVRSDDAMFDLLARYCTPDGRARVPMVAATYTAGGFVDRTGLVPSHVYSVLGFGFHADGRKFVVLRNPWGSSFAGLPSSEYLVPVVGRWLNRLNLNHGDGGCFALAHGAFSSAFMALYGAE
jgi:hypothetical protein